MSDFCRTSIIKSITHKLISIVLLVVSNFNFSFATEPQEIIDFYANPSESHYKKSGNVLAYKNYANQTIVLKSGDYFSKQNPQIEKNTDVIVVPLQDVVAIVGANLDGRLRVAVSIFSKYDIFDGKLMVYKKEDKTIYFPVTDGEIGKYIDLSMRGTESDWTSQFEKHQRGRLKAENIELNDIKQEILTQCTNENIQQLDQLRHTEFQINAIWKSFCSVLNTLELKKDDLMREAVVPKYVKILQLLLPASFALDFQLGSPVYSLFEACNSCKLVPWLTMNRGLNKNFFMFKVLDKQILPTPTTLSSYYPQTIAEKLSGFLTNKHITNFKNVSYNNGTITLNCFYKSTCKATDERACGCNSKIYSDKDNNFQYESVIYKPFKTGKGKDQKNYSESINVPQELQPIVQNIINRANEL